jgi:dTDP-4-amino-4,6-dideoxygalactose transaminase
VERLPVARELGETCLMLLVHHTLMEEEMKIMAGAVLKVMTEAECS